MGVLFALSRWEAKGLCGELDRDSSSPRLAVAVDMIVVWCRASGCAENVTRVTQRSLQKAIGGASNRSRIRFLDDDLVLRLVEIKYGEDSLV